MNNRKPSDPPSARSAPRRANPTSSVPFSLSKDGGFKRPKELAGRSNEVQRSIKMARYLQIRLKAAKLEDELRKRSEYHRDKITRIWTENDGMAEKIHEKRVSLVKLETLKKTFDRLSKEDQFVGDVSVKLKNLENGLDFLFEHLEGQTCHFALQGIDKKTLDQLNGISESLSALDTSTCSELGSLAKEVDKLKSFIVESAKIKENVDRLKSELMVAKQELDALDEISKNIPT